MLTTRLGDAVDPRNFQRAFQSSVRRADVPVIPVHSTPRTCAGLLVALDVHPRVAMTILRHSKIAVTMDFYSQASAPSAREALERLREGFLWAPLPYFAGITARKSPSPKAGRGL